MAEPAPNLPREDPAAEARLRLALRAAELGTWDWDLTANRVVWNDIHERILGYEPGGFPGHPSLFFRAIHPDDAPRMLAVIERARDQRSEYAAEFRIIRPNGEVRWCEGRGIFFYQGDTPVRATGIIRDITDRHQLLARLQGAEERMLRALDAVRMDVWEVDLATERVHHADPSGGTFARPFGRDLPDLASFVAALHPDDRARVVDAVNASITHGVPYSAEYRTVWPDGSIHWVGATGRVQRDERGRPVLLAGVAIDISERRTAEDELGRRNEEYARLLADISGMAYRCRNDPAWTMELVSEGCEALTGYPVSALLHNARLAFGEMIHPEDAGPLWERCQASLAAGRPCSNEYRIRTASGEWKWVWDQAQGIYSSAGELLAIEGLITDITERRRAEEEQLKLGTLLQHSPDFVGMATPEGRVTFINRGGRRMLGLEEGVTPPHISEYFAPEDWAPLERTALPATLAGGSWTGETRFKHFGGQPPVPVEMMAFGIVSPSGVLVAIANVSRDLRERRRAEEERRVLEAQVQHAQKLESLGLLAGGIAHDFNNLLVGILGNASLALGDLPGGSVAADAVHDIELSAQRAAELTRQLLAYSGRGRFVVQPLDLSALVSEMRTLLATVIAKTAAVQLDLAAGLPAVEADATQVRQVVMNLITNASDALEGRSGSITIRTGVREVDRAYLAATHAGDELPEGRYVFLEVADSGVGMDADTQNRVFDPFFTTKTAGHGLGLAAILGIMRGHRGTVRVDSAPGRGASFTVLFPASGVPVAEPEPAAPRRSWRGEGTVLVVDDEEMVRGVARRILSRAGFTVLEAANGREALEVFTRAGADLVLVLLDLTMPEMGGEACFREITQRRPDLRVLLTSGYHEQDASDRLLSMGAAGFVQKPFVVAQLMDAVRTALA